VLARKLMASARRLAQAGAGAAPSTHRLDIALVDLRAIAGAGEPGAVGGGAHQHFRVGVEEAKLVDTHLSMLNF